MGKTRVYSFEKLDVWNCSKSFVIDIYETTNKFPEEEKYGLVSQMRRAAISIASNIAEGSSRGTKQDQARFYVIAYSSTIELLNQLIISHELGYIFNDRYNMHRREIEKITNMLNALRKSLI